MSAIDTELVLVALGAMLAPVTLFLTVLALVLGERPPTQRLLVRARAWLERNARTIAAAVLVLLAGVLLRNGIAGLTG
jgi:ABC-type transport system involved in cytochrome c biogenesis permease subunit